MPLRRLLVMGCLIGAIFALTSPFWYFSSDQERAVPQQPPTISSEPQSTDSHTGRTGTIVLDLDGALSVGAAPSKTNQDVPAPELCAHDNTVQCATISAQEQSSTTGTIIITPAPEPHTGLSAPSSAQLSSASDSARTSAPTAESSTESATAESSTESATAESSTESATAEQAASAEQAATVNEDQPVLSADGAAQIAARTDSTALSEEIIATPDFSQDDKAETELDAKTAALEQEIAALVSKQSAADKKAYQEALSARKEQVDAAIATIAQNSKQYYPPLMSRRALVVFFSVPYEAQVKNDAASQAALSQLLQQGAVGLPPLRSLYSDNSQEQASAKAPDALTGATTIYLLNDAGELEPHQALRFIATTLSEESGAGLYEISPVTTYPTDLVALYAQALNEQLTRHYPELTDDTPIRLDEFDTIYLCYPNWWHDLPSAVYSFFNKFDLSNKLVIPICLSAGDGPALTASTFSYLAPNATLAPWRLNLSHEDCADAQKLSQKLRSFLLEISQNIGTQPQ